MRDDTSSAIPSTFVHTPWGGQGLPGQGGALHRLTDLAQAGPVCSASPGRRLTGWPPIPEIRIPAGGVMPPPSPKAPDLPPAYPYLGDPGTPSCLAPSGGLEP